MLLYQGKYSCIILKSISHDFIRASEGAISTIVSKQGTSGSNVVVTALQFNSHCPTELGIGYSNGEVTVMSLDDPHSPTRIFPLGGDSYTPMIQGGEITKVIIFHYYYKTNN